MNEQKPPNGIEWTRVYGRRGYTWNPTSGCFHGCTWKMPDGSITECYAKTVAEKFPRAYPNGFETHDWHLERLREPFAVKEPSGIFVGSMADLFGHWVPQYQIQQILGVMQGASWHIFQTLSKYPLRIPEFNPYPPNVWVGVSLPAGHQMSEAGARNALKAYLKHMAQVEASVRFMSIEPLWFNAADVFEAWIEYRGKLPFEWAIIGAASKGNKVYQPRPEWVKRLLEIFDAKQIPVFFKGNLDWKPWRECFPGEVWSPPAVVEPVQLQVF